MKAVQSYVSSKSQPIRFIRAGEEVIGQYNTTQHNTIQDASAAAVIVVVVVVIVACY